MRRQRVAINSTRASQTRVDQGQPGRELDAQFTQRTTSGRDVMVKNVAATTAAKEQLLNQTSNDFTQPSE